MVGLKNKVMQLKIKLKLGQVLWFTSDTHYNHTNICRGISKWSNPLDHTRDFQTLDQMNTAIVNGINDCVGQDDVLIHLGDWSFGGFEKIKEFRDRIVCRNIHLVLGNHDHHIESNREGCQSLFSSVNDYLRLTVERETNKLIENPKSEFVLMHFPITSWHDMSRGRIHLHGHVHLNHAKKLHRGRAMDVGLDGNPEFMPYSLAQVLSLLKDRPNRTIRIDDGDDHHETHAR
jgi:calcineurin-like phosphoesterase family protein